MSPRCHPVVALIAMAMGLVTSGEAICPERCDCRPGAEGTIISCRYQRLQGFPDVSLFPDDTVELDFSHNNISAMTYLPTLPNLRRIFLDNCEIKSLDSRAFANVPSLKNITLKDNQIDSIHADAFQGLPNLLGLHMQNNNFKALPANVFDGLNLEHLELEGNAIHRLEDGTFAGLSVNHLNMKGNNISGITASHLQPLRSSLVSFHLDNNGKELTIDANTFDGFTSLEVLSLVSSNLKETSFLGGVNVKTLYLSGNKFPSLDLLPYRSLASVETLGLADMGLQSFRANKILYSLSSLRQLDLSKNGIYMLDGSWFQYTPLLTDLNLASNKLFQLPEDLGTHLGKLKSLDLAMNALSSIREESFDGMKSLMKLDLRNNKMQVFSSTIKPFFDRIPMLMLEGNPLHCNCEMLWYMQWLYTSMSTTAATMCFSPQYTYIYNLQPEAFVCRPPSIVQIEPIVYVEPGTDVFLKCVGEGDPAPIVEWTDPFGEALTISPNVNRTRYKTFNTWKLSSVTEDFNGNYTCRARNVDGEVWQVTTLVVTTEPPPTTEAPTTEKQTTITQTPAPTTSGSLNISTSGRLVETTAETLPVNNNRTTEMTTMRSTDNRKSAISQRTLAIVVGVVGSALILVFIVAITIHICRYHRSRRRYDVNDKAIIYRPDTNELDISKDSKQIEEEESQLMPRPSTAVG